MAVTAQGSHQKKRQRETKAAGGKQQSSVSGLATTGMAHNLGVAIFGRRGQHSRLGPKRKVAEAEIGAVSGVALQPQSL